VRVELPARLHSHCHCNAMRAPSEPPRDAAARVDEEPSGAAIDASIETAPDAPTSAPTGDRTDPDPRAAERIPDALAWASFAIPALCAVCLSGNAMGALDAPELASAAAGLGVTHPPGHPLWVVTAGLGCALVPIGAAPVRVALVSALALGALSRAVLSLCWRATAALDSSPRWRALLSLGAALLATLGVGALRQATRSEVYALAALLAVAPLALLARDSDAAPPDGPRARSAVLLAALGLANHHFIALTAMPALVPALARRLRADTLRRTLGPLAWILANALCLYALLPLRAHAAASLPRPRTISALLDVASARTFARNTGAGVPGTWGSRLADVLDALALSVTPMGILAGLAGLVFAHRRASPLRAHATALSLLFTVPFLSRAWLGFTRDNPDALGYLMPAVVALSVASALATSTALVTLREAERTPGGPNRFARAALLALLVLAPAAGLPLFALSRAVIESAPDRAHASTTLALTPMSSAPPRAVLFAHAPQTIFRLRYAQLVEGERPDVTIVPVPLLGYPGMVERLITVDPALAPLFARYVLQPARVIDPRDATGLATRRFVLLELDPDNVVPYVRYLLPSGSMSLVLEAPSTLADVRAASARHFARFDATAGQLAKETDARGESDEALLWRAYNDALFFAARGARPEARRALDRALERAPEAHHLQSLREALARTPGDGPIDVTPHLPR
jgi:hypothetical protein